MLSEINSNEILTHATTGILAVLILGLIVQSAQTETLLTKGSHSISYPKAMRVFVYVGWSAILIVIALAIFTAKKSDIKSVLCIIGLFTALILPLHLEAFGVCITWDKENIYTKSPWRKRRTIPFYAVRSYDFSATMQWYRIRTEGYGIIRLSQFLRGVPEFLEALPRSSPPNIKTKVVE